MTITTIKDKWKSAVLQSITPVSVHSHIERPVLAEGKSPFCLVHLHGGAASVQEDGVDAAWLHVQVWQQDFQLTETAEHRRHATAAGKMSRSQEVSLTIPFPKWFYKRQSCQIHFYSMIFTSLYSRNLNSGVQILPETTVWNLPIIKQQHHIRWLAPGEPHPVGILGLAFNPSIQTVSYSIGELLFFPTLSCQYEPVPHRTFLNTRQREGDTEAV